jgi:SAM-dependent methyltransferase
LKKSHPFHRTIFAFIGETTMEFSEEQYFAQTYDAFVKDWDGEIEFYRELAAPFATGKGSLLEIGSGTGRVAIRLAKMGVEVVGIDLSAHMIAIAHAKSDGMTNIRWVQADMRQFDLDETFDLAIIPGHAFQFMLTGEAQMECLASIRRHLKDAARLVIHLDHQDLGWLGSLPRQAGEIYKEVQRFTHPQTGRLVRTWRAWSYAPSTQTASSMSRWEETGEAGQVFQSGRRGPIQLHCAFRFEMEHLLARAGFETLALYGDFHKEALRDDSSEMIWVVRK